MGWVVALVLIGVPIAEIWLLIVVGGRIGFWPTVAFVVAVGAVGLALARAEGARVVRNLQLAMREGRVPEEGMVSGLFVLLGGVLLVTPGFITDVAGVLLLFPPTRKIAVRVAHAWLAKKIAQGKIVVVNRLDDRRDGDRRDDDDVIDV